MCLILTISIKMSEGYRYESDLQVIRGYVYGGGVNQHAWNPNPPLL